MVTEQERLLGMLEFESLAKEKGYKTICGLDEAGRGPLAGPVVAAACILPQTVYDCPEVFYGLNDSKKLTPAQRNTLFQALTTYPQLYFGVGIIDHEVIDAVNIHQAVIQAMLKALSALIKLLKKNKCSSPDLLLVDGLKLPIFSTESWKIIKGDQKSQSIAAASIIAKVTRDGLMDKYHKKWPQYGFKDHKGYGTECHLLALAQYGPSPIHRRSFAPVRESVIQEYKNKAILPAIPART